MFKLDNTFLEEVDLGSLPEAEKRPMLGHIYETLEMRVGMKLAEQMTDDQLKEFERFVNGDTAHAVNFLNTTKPNWQQAPEYHNAYNSAKSQAEKAGAPFNDGAVVAEFAALTWLETNFPGYKQVVADELEKLKAEIKAAAPQILAGMAASPAPAEQQQGSFAPQPQPQQGQTQNPQDYDLAA